jgi:hypothetical protein
MVTTRRHLFPPTAAWVARRNEAAERLEQAAIEACLFDCANDEERQLVLRVLRERATNRASAARARR